ncbi:hypothetical protein BGZ94_010212 [Podila epigama]|nr:hypothetical protein BGZ94_010212 [Podila epigama]
MSTAESSTQKPKGPEESTAKPEVPLTPEEEEKLSKPVVLISGAGIAGLMLGVLLYKADIPFLIFEKAKEVRPLGGLVGTLFTQLGIMDEFVQLSKRLDHCQMYTEDLKPTNVMDIGLVKEITGYDQYVIARPDLYLLLLRQIPRNRILLGKRILSFTQDSEKISIHCADNSIYEGDILVGADGAYSAVRQHMYKELKVTGDLPACDGVVLPFSCVCLVGQTFPLDPEEFPVMKPKDSEFSSVLGRDSYCTWLTMTTKQNTACWMVIQFLNKDTEKDNDAFRNSEWGWEAAEAMAKEVKEFKIPGLRNGKPMTLGDYVDNTPLEQMAKVMLEEIVFDTWHNGRAVLIGDACHKMNPTGGVGAAHAIHDAVALANWITTLRKPTVKELDKVFKEYCAERYPVAKAAYASSQLFRRNFGKNMTSAMTRAMLKRMPFWMYRLISKKMLSARNQVSFLPLVKDTGKGKPRYQPSLQKTLKILKEQEGLSGAEIIARKAPELRTASASAVAI